MSLADDLRAARQPNGDGKPTDTGPPRLKGQSAEELGKIEFPPQRWAVDGLLAEGLTILAGRPKIGKSWLALGAAIAVATGGEFLGVPVEQGPALYLALEDGERRVKRRLQKMLGPTGTPWPQNLILVYECPRLGEGAGAAIHAAIEQWKPRLTVIDTFQRIRPVRRAQADVVTEDYEAVAALQKLALKQQISIVPVAHTRKKKEGQEAEDPLDEVLGTTGTTAACDAVLVLNRKRKGDDGTLFLTGRDVQEVDLAVAFKPEYGTWVRNAAGDGPQLSADQLKIVAILSAQAGLSPLIEIAEAFGKGKNYEALKKLVQRLAEDGAIEKVAYGLYAFKGYAQQERQNDNHDTEGHPDLYRFPNH